MNRMKSRRIWKSRAWFILLASLILTQKQVIFYKSLSRNTKNLRFRVNSAARALRRATRVLRSASPVAPATCGKPRPLRFSIGCWWCVCGEVYRLALLCALFRWFVSIARARAFDLFILARARALLETIFENKKGF